MVVPLLGLTVRMLIVEYACADGAPFPVSFAMPVGAALRWHLEREHVRGPMSPLRHRRPGIRLPCVVGTKVATTAIPDGAEVIVDGSAGTIEIVG